MLHNHLLGSSAEINPITKAIDTDVGSILRRLLLFDKYTLISIRLLEIPAIVQSLGIDAAIEIIRSKSLRFYIPALSIAQVGQAALFRSKTKKGNIAKGNYSFQFVVPHNSQEYLARCFREAIDSIPTPVKKRVLLKKTILDALDPVPPDLGRITLTQLYEDLRIGNPALNTSVINQLKKKLGKNIDTSRLNVRLIPLGDEDYETDSNLEALFGLNLEERHKIVERAVLDLSGVNKRLAEMCAFNAISGFRIDDLPIFEQKVAFLVNSIDPDKQESRVSRLFEVVDLPDFNEIGTKYKLNVSKFLEIRKSKECEEFRAWLPSIDASNEKEIKDIVNNFRAYIASVLNSSTGRALRFLIQEGLGAIPGVGLVLGSAASVLDTFIVDRIFKESKIATFVSKQYPALFEDLEK